ncbi:MAG: ParA family protein [Acidobacteriota bacterium]
MRYVVFNRKGGVGKSTIVCNLAAVNAMAGRRTLVVDLDPQGNATQYLTGHDPGELKPGLLEYFEGTLGFKLLRSAADDDFIHPTRTEGLDLLPSSPDLQELQTKLETRHKIYKLRDLLDELGRYDDVFIDTPPAVSFFTISALIASESCLIPFDCDEFSRRALFQLLETVAEVREDHNPRLRVGGVVVNQFQSRARLPRELVAELRDEGLTVLEPYLGASVKVRESHRVHRPLVDYLPRHKLSDQFRDLHANLPRSPG